MKSFNLSAWALAHRPLMLFLLLITLLGGALAFSRLGRLEDPNFNVPLMTAVVFWPGAQARELQDSVLNRIEREFQELDGIDYVKSYARQGYGAITVGMKGGTAKADLERAWYQARKKITDIGGEFPVGVEGPFFNDEFSDLYSVLYAIRAPDLSNAERNDLAETVRRALRQVTMTHKVDVLGKQPERVYVDLPLRRLTAWGLTLPEVLATLTRQNVVAASGSADTPVDRVHLRVDGRLRSVADVAAVPVRAGGRIVHLGDIARVYGGSEEPPRYSIRQRGEDAVVIGVSMARNGNILALGEALDARMAQVRAQLPAGVRIEKYADQPAVVAESVREFEKSFLEALAIVLAVSFVALGWRTGVVVAISVPLVLGLVALTMYLANWSLDRISLGALIIALGLLVDDAIIAVEMMVVRMEQGWDRVRAATAAYSVTAMPMLTGTLVTVAGFMPVGFAHSIAGEYAGGIFWVVGVALLASWLVAVTFTPTLGVLLLPERPHTTAAPDRYNSAGYRRLRAAVTWSLTNRKTVLGVTVALFFLAVAGMTQVQQQFFPTASRLELLVDLRTREGGSFAATMEQVQRLEKHLHDDPDIATFTAYTGAGSPRFYLSISPELPNPGYAQIVIKTRSIAARERLRTRLLALFSQGNEFPRVRARVQRMEFGPPVGFPVQFRVIGDDPAQLRRVAGQIRDVMAKSPLLKDSHLEWNEQVRALHLHVDQDKARALGIHSSDIAATLQALQSGIRATQIRRAEELVDVVVRASAEERGTLADLDGISVSGTTGRAVPLGQIARSEARFEEPVLWRRDRQMALTVRADLVDGIQGPYATQRLWPALQPLIAALPAGYRIEAGGAIEESDKANRALYAVFAPMIVIMLLLLMLQLKSFARVGMVFLTAPLGLIGVVPALLAFNAPFGFVALLGVIALSGMIQRNATILVDQIEQDIAAGQTAWTAVIEATVRRARPVLLTAAAAILAMIPLTRSVFWGPMAMAIMGGLIVATALTLVAVPALYAAWFGIKDPAGEIRRESDAPPSAHATQPPLLDQHVNRRDHDQG